MTYRSWIQQATTSSRAENTECIYCIGHYALSKSPELGNKENSSQGFARFPTGVEPKARQFTPLYCRSGLFGGDQVNIEAMPIAYWRNEELFVQNKVICIPVYDDIAVTTLVHRTLTTTLKRFDNHLLDSIGTFVVRTANTIVISPNFLTRIFKSIIDNPGFIASISALNYSKQQNIVPNPAKFENACQQFVETVRKTVSRPVLSPSDESIQLLTIISYEDKKSPWLTLLLLQ